MFKLKLRHTFAAAHQLEHAYSKECNDFLHGHNWVVKVELSTNELVNGMVADFKLIKTIINSLDHKNLNEILTFETTCENLSKYLHDKILTEITGRDVISGSKRILKLKIELYEAEKASIEYSS